MKDIHFVPVRDNYPSYTNAEFAYTQYSYIHENYSATFADILIAYKKYFGVTDEGLGKLLGVHRNNVVRYRYHEFLPYQRCIPNFSEVLGIDPFVLAYCIVKELYPFSSTAAIKVLVFVSCYALGVSLPVLDSKLDFSLNQFINRPLMSANVIKSLRRRVAKSLGLDEESVDSFRSCNASETREMFFLCHKTYTSLKEMLCCQSDICELFYGKYTNANQELIKSFFEYCNDIGIHTVESLLQLYSKESGFCEREIARRLECSNQAVNNWINGKAIPASSILIRLSDLLSIHPLTLSLFIYKNGDGHDFSLLHFMAVVCAFAIGKSYSRFYNSTALCTCALFQVCDISKAPYIGKNVKERLKLVLGLDLNQVLVLRELAPTCIREHYSELLDMYRSLLSYCKERQIE